MAVITFTESEVARCHPHAQDEAFNVRLIASGVAGHAVYQDPTTGGYALAVATASGTAGFRGIMLESNLASGTVSVLRRGVLYGYDLSGMSYDAPVYLSDTPGMLADAAGSVSVLVGRVISVNDKAMSKVVYIDAELASAGDLG